MCVCVCVVCVCVCGVCLCVCSHIEVQSSLSPLNRNIPIDMAGFAVNVEILMKNRNVWMGRMAGGQVVRDGFLETEFLSQFVTRNELECRSYEKEVM